MTVFLVATGPGDPALLTVRVERLLATADVVAVEPEVAPAIVELAGPDTDVVEVARDDGAALVALVSDRADPDRADPDRADPDRADSNPITVVRLSSGDRLALEAGGREAAALRRAGLDHEVVPVVLAALSLPTTRGVPVMSRDLAPVLTIAVGTASSDRARADTTLVTLPDPSAPTVGVDGAVAAMDLRRPIAEARP